jgi:predicted site-specific integrase-resolvase
MEIDVVSWGMHEHTNTSAPFLTRRHLIDRWVVSLETLKRYEKAGRLPFLKIGRDVRYRTEEIERIEREAEVRP